MAEKRPTKDEVFTRIGTSTVGEIQNKTFAIVDDLGERKIKLAEIWDIIFAGPGTQPKDRVRLRNGGVLVADVLEDPIIFREAASGEVMELHKKQLLAIMLIRF